MDPDDGKTYSNHQERVIGKCNRPAPPCRTLNSIQVKGIFDKIRLQLQLRLPMGHLLTLASVTLTAAHVSRLRGCKISGVARDRSSLDPPR